MASRSTAPTTTTSTHSRAVRGQLSSANRATPGHPERSDSGSGVGAGLRRAADFFATALLDLRGAVMVPSSACRKAPRCPGHWGRPPPRSADYRAVSSRAAATVSQKGAWRASTTKALAACARPRFLLCRGTSSQFWVAFAVPCRTPDVGAQVYRGAGPLCRNCTPGDYWPPVRPSWRRRCPAGHRADPGPTARRKSP